MIVARSAKTPLKIYIMLYLYVQMSRSYGQHICSALQLLYELNFWDGAMSPR